MATRFKKKLMLNLVYVLYRGLVRDGQLEKLFEEDWEFIRMRALLFFSNQNDHV